MKLLDIKAIQWGYSDIRMWPCYMILCISVLVCNIWFGLFWATVLVGLPVFYISLRLLKLHDPNKAPIAEVDVFAEIDRIVKEHEENNYLLRRNMKIIQEDESYTKQANNITNSKLYNKPS